MYVELYRGDFLQKASGKGDGWRKGWQRKRIYLDEVQPAGEAGGLLQDLEQSAAGLPLGDCLRRHLE